MIHHMVDLLAVAGLKSTEDIKPEHINRRIDGADIQTYADIYEHLKSGCLLKNQAYQQTGNSIGK